MTPARTTAEVYKRPPSHLWLRGLLISSGLLVGAANGMSQEQPPAVPVPTPVQGEQTIDTEAPQALHLLVGRSLVITSPARIKRVSLADPNIAEAIAVTPNEILLTGKAPGGVSLIIWDEAEQ